MSAPYSRMQLMACVLARAFRDGEVVVMGAVPALPLAACRLAKALHAPSLSYVVGGSGTVNPAPDGLPSQSCDPELRGGPVTLPLHEVVLLEGRGGARAGSRSTLTATATSSESATRLGRSCAGRGRSACRSCRPSAAR